MAQLRRLTVRGFKSIRELEDFELRGINMLIGINGAGKSNLLSLFHLLAALADGRLQLYVQEHGGPDALLFGTRKRTQQLEVELGFGRNAYSATLRPSDERMLFASEDIAFWGDSGDYSHRLGSGHDESRLPDADNAFARFVQPAIANWRVFHFRDTNTESAMRQRQPVRDNLRLKADGANIAPFLRYLRERYHKEHERIVRTVRMAAPFFGDFVYRRDPGERVELEWFETSDPDTPWGARQLSDGVLRFICLATLLLQPAELQPDTILLDEPELGLHPYALELLAGLLHQASDARQLIVSTQSVELLNQFDPDDVVVVSRRAGASVFERLDPGQLEEWLEDYSLGELWKSNVIGGNPTQ